jgi:hypothetical protein
VRDDFRVARGFFEGGDERLGPTHKNRRSGAGGATDGTI